MAPVRKNSAPQPGRGGAIVVRQPGGGLVRTRAATTAPVNWVQRIQTGLVDTAKRAIPLGGMLRGAGLGQALWEGINAPPAADGTLDAARRRGDMGATRGGGRPIGSLPTSARVPSQYPAGVPTGIGGGNAGGSRAASAPPPPPRQVSRVAPIFQAPPPPPPGQGNVARPVTGRGGRERAYTAMVQQAGLTQEQADAAQTRGQAALQYRQGGAPAPEILDPSQQEYWDQADIKAWASANKSLADKLKAKHGYVEPGSIFGITRSVTRQLPNFTGTAEQAYASTDSNPFLPEVSLGSKFNIPDVQPHPDAFRETAWQPDPAQANRAFSPEGDAISPYGKAADLLGKHLDEIRRGQREAPPSPSPQSDEDLLRGVNPWNLNWRK